MAFLSLLHLYLSGYCGYSDGATAILQGLIMQTYSSMDYVCSIFVAHTISAQKSICARKIEQKEALCRQTYYSDYSTVTSSDSQVTSSLIGVIHFPFLLHPAKTAMTTSSSRDSSLQNLLHKHLSLFQHLPIFSLPLYKHQTQCPKW